MIGFTIIWILLETTQGKTHPISPVTALWIIAIPLMDMVAIMYRRLRKGMSPFSPDRQHIHHLIMRAGFTSRQAFVLITLPPPCWRWLRRGGIHPHCAGMGDVNSLFGSLLSLWLLY